MSGKLLGARTAPELPERGAVVLMNGRTDDYQLLLFIASLNSGICLYFWYVVLCRHMEAGMLLLAIIWSVFIPIWVLSVTNWIYRPRLVIDDKGVAQKSAVRRRVMLWRNLQSIELNMGEFMQRGRVRKFYYVTLNGTTPKIRLAANYSMSLDDLGRYLRQRHHNACPETALDYVDKRPERERVPEERPEVSPQTKAKLNAKAKQYIIIALALALVGTKIWLVDLRAHLH